MIAFTALALLLLGATTPSLAGELNDAQPLRRAVTPHTLETQRGIEERGFFQTAHRLAKHRKHHAGAAIALRPLNGTASKHAAKAKGHDSKKKKSKSKGKAKAREAKAKEGNAKTPHKKTHHKTATHHKKTATHKHAATGSGAVKASTNGTPASFAKEAVKRHNLYRKEYGAKPLVWSTTLAAAAQKWASQCKWQHSGGSVGAYGENIAAGQTSIDAVVDAWVNGPNESSAYDPKNPTASHFTQVVWKATKQVGCAQQVCPGIAGLPQANPVFWVCEYAAPGNVYPASNFLKNVGSKKS